MICLCIYNLVVAGLHFYPHLYCQLSVIILTWLDLMVILLRMWFWCGVLVVSDVAGEDAAALLLSRGLPLLEVPPDGHLHLKKEMAPLKLTLDLYWPSLYCSSFSTCFSRKGPFWLNERSMKRAHLLLLRMNHITSPRPFSMLHVICFQR